LSEQDQAEWVFVGLGSNEGDSQALLAGAVSRLREMAGGEVVVSSLWGSEPVGCPAGSPDFINAVAGFRPVTGLSPELCLKWLQQLEGEFGRCRGGIRNAPRVLDLDLLVFGSEVRSGRSLELPHPRISERRFVLAPWAEISPGLRLPILERTVGELLAALAERPRVWPVLPSGKG
jgi:2-amino-4-hydroxy-6-hydroxymethyldihydropteridine diphosphokinase